MPGQEPPGIELATMIGALRDSLDATQRAGADSHGPRFQVREIEVEATVETTLDIRGSGTVKFWVVDAGLETGRARASTQRVLLRLSVGSDYTIARPLSEGDLHDLP
ncbi:hypothetical protein BKM31_18710 [[Actinomadura] parvosata subsp. kistnae]|uniref:Trypsin-co-occurring domain-containing protein n=1 Tax=[Actinomadura] parvosata subsp. kistnae TaxID=1909395 RepID=A0A1U9ZZ66_9ACTN|nr:trypco2 family protein [Nonomuraea sp. ATCC 55076]AQZ63219.1 hypothetical protein BKM31_18710 [Nonomuraea sp. ATCC 55076]